MYELNAATSMDARIAAELEAERALVAEYAGVPVYDVPNEPIASGYHASTWAIGGDVYKLVHDERLDEVGHAHSVVDDEGLVGKGIVAPYDYQPGEQFIRQDVFPTAREVLRAPETHGFASDEEVIAAIAELLARLHGEGLTLAAITGSSGNILDDIGLHDGQLEILDFANIAEVDVSELDDNAERVIKSAAAALIEADEENGEALVGLLEAVFSAARETPAVPQEKSAEVIAPVPAEGPGADSGIEYRGGAVPAAGIPPAPVYIPATAPMTLALVPERGEGATAGSIAEELLASGSPVAAVREEALVSLLGDVLGDKMIDPIRLASPWVADPSSISDVGADGSIMIDAKILEVLEALKGIFDDFSVGIFVPKETSPDSPEALAAGNVVRVLTESGIKANIVDSVRVASTTGYVAMLSEGSAARLSKGDMEWMKTGGANDKIGIIGKDVLEAAEAGINRLSVLLALMTMDERIGYFTTSQASAQSLKSSLKLPGILVIVPVDTEKLREQYARKLELDRAM
jgi:hypothetical protein